MDDHFANITVKQFRQALLDAADRVHVVKPAALREPLALWLRAVEERASRENWRNLRARETTAPWNAARAILATPVCGAMGWWGHSRFFCDLAPGHASEWHENNDELPGVIWLGDHTPPCADCPEVLPDGTANADRCQGDLHVIPHRWCILR